MEGHASLRDEKADLRRRIRKALAALPPLRRAQEEAIVNAYVASDPVWRGASVVLAYHAKTPEFSVVAACNEALRAGRRLVMPRVEGRRLELHEVSAWEDLVPGAFGLREPRPELPVVAPEDIEVALVPGLAFDGVGNRLGQGGGFYDRLLPRVAGPTWGTGFDVQVVARVPHGEEDVPVGRVLAPRLVAPAT